MLSPQIEMYLHSRLAALLKLGMDEQEAIAFVEDLFRSGYSYCKQQIKELELKGNYSE